jgi:signal recognition particle GTPase
MRFFSKTLDKLKGALRKTAAVLNTDVRTLFVPGRQIDDAFLEELYEKLVRADMGVKNVERITIECASNGGWERSATPAEAEQIVRGQLLNGWGPAETRELRFASADRRWFSWPASTARARRRASPSWRGC